MKEEYNRQQDHVLQDHQLISIEDEDDSIIDIQASKLFLLKNACHILNMDKAYSSCKKVISWDLNVKQIFKGIKS